MGKNECKKAMIATLNVLKDKCEAERGSVIEIEPEGTMLYVPEEVQQLKEGVGNPVSEEEVEKLMKESPWLGNWASAMCKISGVEPGEPEYESCRKGWARRALEAG